MAWTDGLTGRVIVRDSPEYEIARQDYNARFSKFPAVIVYCRTAQDAANSIRWVRKQKIPFRIRSGGHSYEAFSLVDDGLVIDVSELLHLQIDKVNGIARIGAGYRMLPLYEALWKKGLTIPGGSCPTTGVSGLTLGGGYGFLSRQLGMTCDKLIEIEMIDAQGNLIRANDKQNSSLLWACRGGGDGNFGVVTSFTFRVYPIGDVSYYTMDWDFADLDKAVLNWQAWAPHTDARLTSLLKLPAQNEGDIRSLGVFVGLEKELRRIVRPIQEAIPPKKITFRSASWIEVARRLGGSEVIRQAKFKNSSAYVYEPFPDAAIATLAKNLKSPYGTSNLVVFDAYGGSIPRVPPEATAFVHRQALFVMQYQTYWEQGAEEADNIRWVEQFRQSMLPYTSGANRDYCDILIPDWQTAYFGENIDKLKKVKQIYDPENLFCFEQSIPPLTR